MKTDDLAYSRGYATQHKYTYYNDTQHNGNMHNDTNHNLCKVSLCWMSLYWVSWRCTHLSSQDETLAKEYLLKGRTSTIDLQVLSFSDQLLLVQDTYIFLILQNKEVNRTEPSPSVRVPWIDQQPNLVLFRVKCASGSVSIDKMICHRLNFGQIWSIFSDFIWQTNSFFQNVFYLLQLVESLTLGYKRLLFI